MKVLTAIIVPPHMTASGAVRAAETLSTALAAHCRMTVASMMSSGKGDTGLVTRWPVRTRLPRALTWSKLPNRARTLFYKSDIADAVHHGGFDLVHLHNPMPSLEMRRVARACRRAGVPYLVSTHGFNEIANGHAIYGFGRPMRMAWRTLVYRPVAQVVRDAAAILALSPADVSIVEAMGCTRDIFIIPNGIEPPKAVTAARQAEILRKFDIPSERKRGEIVCMFLGNHTPNKGLPVLLQAFRSLDIPYLLIVGGEPRQGLDYGARRPTKSGQRIVLTGRLEDDEVTALMRRSDAFVFPTLADTLPLVVFEAIAHGLAVVASRVGGIPYQIDQSCGSLVPPGDVNALAAEIKRLAGNPALLASMRAGATARAATFASWETAASQTMAVYRAVLEKSIEQTDSKGEPVRFVARTESRVTPTTNDIRHLAHRTTLHDHHGRNTHA